MRSEWPARPLGELTANFDTRRKPVKESERIRGPYPYYGASGIVDRVNDYIFNGEYLLIAEDGENLRTRNTPVAFRAVGKFWVNNHAHIFKPKGDISIKYLNAYFNSLSLNEYVTGTAQPKLTKFNLCKIILR